MFTNPFWINLASMRPNLRFVGDGEQGGSGGGNGGNGGNDNQNQPGAGDVGQNGNQPGAGNGSATETPEQTIARLTSERDALAREKENVRIQKEGSIKAEAKRTELLNLARVLGTEGVEDNMSLEQITEKITGKALQNPAGDQAAADARKNTLDSAVVREAWLQKVDPSKADYLAFKVSQNPAFATLDPSAADFQQQISSIVKSTTENDPVFAVTPGGSAGNGGGDHGGSGGANEITKEAFDSMTVSEKTALFNDHREVFNRLVSA